MHKLKCKPTARDTYLQKRYKITEAIYRKMLEHGQGGCHICGRLPKPGKNLHVDHAHDKYREVRGLLCYTCNKLLIGRSTYKHAWLYTKAAEYLLSTKDWRE